MTGASKAARVKTAGLSPAPDRYLQKRADGGYRYRRRIPDRFAALVGADWSRCSLRTGDLALARQRRDAQERADDELWGSLVAGDPRPAAFARYEAARLRAQALGFSYAPAADLAATAPLDEILRRLAALGQAGGAGAPARDIDALLGAIDFPTVSVSDAFRIYTDEIEAGQRARKSPAQYASWLKVKKRAVGNFIAVCGDVPIGSIGRVHAQKFHKHWLGRVAAGEVGVSRAERDFGNIRALWRDYMRFAGLPDDMNPFRNLSFGKEFKRSRPPIPAEWIAKKILKRGALGMLKDEARAVLLVMIETGARPSEICNLPADHICLDAKVPHIKIAPTKEFEIKTDSSVREIPLLGVALAAMKKHPHGFPRYRDKATSWSNLVNKRLRESKLLPKGCSVYSLRHSFEDRMKEAGVDEGLRRQLMGHADSRPRYGGGGAMEWRRDELAKITLPFDPRSV